MLPRRLLPALPDEDLAVTIKKVLCGISYTNKKHLAWLKSTAMAANSQMSTGWL